MQDRSVFSVLLALSFAALPTSQSAKRASLPEATCVNLISREPVVLYEVSGGTLTGPVDYMLSVYGDGSARLSSHLGGAGTGSSQFASLSTSVVEALRADLAAAGALAECDQEDLTNDAPLQTLTVFRSGAGRRSNTFSWFSSAGNLADVQATLDAFLAAHFVAPPGGNDS